MDLLKIIKSVPGEAYSNKEWGFVKPFKYILDEVNKYGDYSNDWLEFELEKLEKNDKIKIFKADSVVITAVCIV
ncbi:MAG: hypothetical protein FWE74_02975 [Oscillospiraceae bacterium]|nr:hypothetical protein [Oscillospiraceae bacterium]